MQPPKNDPAALYEALHEAIQELQGYEIHLHVHYAAQEDVVAIGLRGGSARPDRTLAFQNVYYSSFYAVPDCSARLLDHIQSESLDLSDDSWPADLPLGIKLASRYPMLIWVRGDGSGFRFELVAAQGGVSSDPPFQLEVPPGTWKRS